MRHKDLGLRFIGFILEDWLEVNQCRFLNLRILLSNLFLFFLYRFWFFLWLDLYSKFESWLGGRSDIDFELELLCLSVLVIYR